MAREELPQKVLLAVINEPLNETEIGVKIYKKKRQTYPKLMGEDGAIKKCVDRGWIRQVWLKIPKKKPHAFELMKYYYADIYPILEEINQELNLTEDEEDKLEEILDSDSFRATVGFASKKIDYMKSINTFEIIKEEIAVLSAFSLICKNYTVYLTTKKFKQHLSKKDRKIDFSRLTKSQIEEMITQAKKKGTKINQILEDGISFLYQLIPVRLRIINKDEINNSIELGEDFYSLSPEFCEKLSKLSSYYTDLILIIIGMSFFYPEKANKQWIDHLTKMIRRLKLILEKHKIRIQKI